MALWSTRAVHDIYEVGICLIEFKVTVLGLHGMCGRKWRTLLKAGALGTGFVEPRVNYMSSRTCCGCFWSPAGTSQTPDPVHCNVQAAAIARRAAAAHAGRAHRSAHRRQAGLGWPGRRERRRRALRRRAGGRGPRRTASSAAVHDRQHGAAADEGQREPTRRQRRPGRLQRTQRQCAHPAMLSVLVALGSG